MTGFQESDPGVEGRRVEGFQRAIAGARVGKGSSLGGGAYLVNEGVKQIV
jgi:tetrahydrodipicolinate N-succinyltransferase